MASDERHIFADRFEAGAVLAAKLGKYARDPKALVLALPRGGVPVAYEVSRALRIPLDVFVVRKLGLPGQEELAMGAIASGGVRILNLDVVRTLGVSNATIEEAASREMEELVRREQLYRGDVPMPQLTGRRVILVDDGLATGSSMRAAITALRKRNTAKIVAAVPVAAPQVCGALREAADEVVCARTPEPFYAVGLWYRNFSQTTDEEIRQLLERARQNA